MNYLQGNNVKLVKFTDKFITLEYISWLNDPNVNKYLYTGRVPIELKDIKIVDDNQNLKFAIMSNVAKSKNKEIIKDKNYLYYVGTISLSNINWIDRKCDIGYMIGSQDHWGLGIATEIIGLISDYAFGRLNLNKLTAGVVDGNMGSARALEKNGFKRWGTSPQDYFLDGEFLDAIEFYKLKGAKR